MHDIEKSLHYVLLQLLLPSPIINYADTEGTNTLSCEPAEWLPTGRPFSLLQPWVRKSADYRSHDADIKIITWESIKFIGSKSIEELHIPNSAEQNIEISKPHTVSEKQHKINKFGNYQNIIVRNSDRHGFVPSQNGRPLVLTSYTWSEAKPLTRPLMITLQVVRTSFGFHLRECMGSSLPPWPIPYG